MREIQHSAACASCGRTCPYLGRRDLIEVLERVATILEPQRDGLEAWPMRAALARDAAMGALETVHGKCPYCC
jgi:hypothetical protein